MLRKVDYEGTYAATGSVNVIRPRALFNRAGTPSTAFASTAAGSATSARYRPGTRTWSVVRGGQLRGSVDVSASTSGPFHTKRCRGGVHRRQLELKGVEVCRD